MTHLKTTQLAETTHRDAVIRTYDDAYTYQAGTDAEHVRHYTRATVQFPGVNRQQGIKKTAGGKDQLSSDQLIKKARTFIDLKLDDDEIRPRVRQVMQSVPGYSAMNHKRTVDPTKDKVGDDAWVWGQNRWRHGIITKIAKTQATVAYTTPSSDGRIYRPARPFADVKVKSA